MQDRLAGLSDPAVGNNVANLQAGIEGTEDVEPSLHSMSSDEEHISKKSRCESDPGKANEQAENLSKTTPDFEDKDSEDKDTSSSLSDHEEVPEEADLIGKPSVD